MMMMMMIIIIIIMYTHRSTQFRMKHAVAQLVEALRYKLEGRGFDFLLR
jgi:transposase